MMVLNENIHEFDKKETKGKQHLHSFEEWIKRIIYLIDAKLFEKTYKEEWEETNVENDKLKQRIRVLDNKNKRLLKKQVKEKI